MKRGYVWGALALMLVAIMALSMWVPSAKAAETEKTLYFSTSIEGANPLYAIQAPLVTVEEEESTIHTAEDFDDAVKELREIMKNRETVATLFVPVEISSSFSDEAALRDELVAYATAMLDGALAHTGKGDEGDYLRHTYNRHHISLALWGDSENTELELTFQFVYHTTAQQEADLNEFLPVMLSSWHLEDATDYEKVCAVYDWLCENVIYSNPIPQGASTAYAAYGAIMEWDAVCQGYATAMYRMLLELGVDCRVIDGIGIDNAGNYGPHAWNIVKLGDYYYNADATWDALWLAAGEPYAWYLTSDENFPFHEREAKYMTESFYTAYPMGQENYDPSVREEPILSGTCGKNLTWMLTGDGILTISGTGDMDTYDVFVDVYAPWVYMMDSIKRIVIEDGVTSTGNWAFFGCSNVTDITLPESMTQIGVSAFYHCESLTDITIPKGVTSIGLAAFAYSGLTDIPALGSVTEIPNGAFSDCLNLSDIAIPKGVTAVGFGAFYGCKNLAGVTIPESVTSIEEFAFGGCSKLKLVQFLGDAPAMDPSERIFEQVEATVYYPAGNATWTEEVMQDYGGNITWVPYGEEETLCQFLGTSVSLGDSLDMHFFLDGDDVDMTDYALITRSYGDGRADEEIMIPGIRWGVLDDGSVYVTYEGIAAKEMGDTVTITIYDFEGNAVSEVYADNIRDYAMRLLEKESDPELLTLLVDMLNYGTEAQKHFGYDTENSVNGQLTETQKSYATAAYEVESVLVSGTGRAATALTLKNRISLDLLFDCGVIGVDFADLHAEVTYTDHNGEAVAYRIEGKDFVEAEGFRVCVSVTGLAVADYGQAVTCTVYDAEGNAIAWATDSISGYVARMEGKIPEMVSAIAKFGTAAWNYFH